MDLLSSCRPQTRAKGGRSPRRTDGLRISSQSSHRRSHSCTGHNYMGNNYIGHGHVGRNYTGHDHIGHDYTCPSYIGHDYIGGHDPPPITYRP